jgi:transcriptional regulator with XRE-family HTH domain
MCNIARMSIDTLSKTIRPAWSVADRLRKARELTGLGINEFAHEIGISARSVGRYENGAEPPRRVLLLWKMITNVSVEWLQNGDEMSEESHLRDSNSGPSHYKAKQAA